LEKPGCFIKNVVEFSLVEGTKNSVLLDLSLPVSLSLSKCIGIEITCIGNGGHIALRRCYNIVHASSEIVRWRLEEGPFFALIMFLPCYTVKVLTALLTFVYLIYFNVFSKSRGPFLVWFPSSIFIFGKTKGFLFPFFLIF
jgi:hypothetical protein